MWIREEIIPTLEEIAWLRSPAGREVCQRMASQEPTDTPAGIQRWRERLDARLVAAASHQVMLRALARAKFSLADQMLFDRSALEQASDETVARYKAQRFARLERVTDFCSGIGGDALALAQGRELIAMDRSASRLAMAEHNVAVYGGSAMGVVDDVGANWPKADGFHLDPSRREGGRRSHQLIDHSPGPEVMIRAVQHYPAGCIKLSPGVNFSTLPFEAEIELVSHHGDCKQALAWTGAFRRAFRSAVALPGGESVTADAADQLAWPSPRAIQPGDYLYEPDAAIIRADLVGVLARRHNLTPVDRRISYLVGSELPRTSLAQSFRVLEVSPWSHKTLRQRLARLEIGHLEIKTRGFAARPEDILRQLKPAGSRTAVLLLTRIETRPTAILAERPS